MLSRAVTVFAVVLMLAAGAWLVAVTWRVM